MKSVQFLVAALLLVTSPVILAEKPDPVNNPPLQVREANTDPLNGDAIRVHEQGIARVDIVDAVELDVNVTGGSVEVSSGSVEVSNTNANPVPIEGTVTVDSFPDQQDVWVDGGFLSPVTNAYYDIYDMERGTSTGRVNFTNGPILATLVYISKDNHEVLVEFFSDALAPAGENVILAFRDKAGNLTSETITLPNPMEISGFNIDCLNENDNCYVHITVVGF